MTESGVETVVSGSGSGRGGQPALLDALLDRPAPLLALAPMQEVTDLPFWRLLAARGGPDVYWTEYFRVHSTSRLEKSILRSLDENPTGRPAIAQLIGNDENAMAAAARELQHHPIAAIDLNLGCPAPVVYRKCAGGGLLREPQRIDRLLGRLRETIGRKGIRFTVKTRIGFDAPDAFPSLLAIFSRHSLDLLTVHGRTVLEMYRPPVHYDRIREAVEIMPCPVLANGNVDSPRRAQSVLEATGARGLMIGRGCIRNPWLYDQIRQHLAGEPVQKPTGRDLLNYIHDLWQASEPVNSVERLQVVHMKRYMNFVGAGVSADPVVCTEFLHRIRRATTRIEFFAACSDVLDHDRLLDLVPPEANPEGPSGCG